MRFDPQPPQLLESIIKKRKRFSKKTIEPKAEEGPAALPSRGQGYDLKSSAEKYAERTKELRGFGQSKEPEKPDFVSYSFDTENRLPPMTFHRRQKVFDAKKLLEVGEDGVGDRKKGCEGQWRRRGQEEAEEDPGSE